MGTTLCNDAASAWRRHARTETVATFANQFTGLISTFHIITPVLLPALLSIFNAVAA